MVMQTVILGFSFYCLELVRRLSRFYRDSDSVDHSRQLFVGRIEFSRAKGFMQRKMDPFLWKSIESIGLSYIYTLKYGIQYFFSFFLKLPSIDIIIWWIRLIAKPDWTLMDNLHENRSHWLIFLMLYSIRKKIFN